MVSTTNAETAYIWVTGEEVVEGPGKSTWKIVSTVPVDASGNSLAGESESEQEAAYGTIDLVVMSSTRFSPVFTQFTVTSQWNLGASTFPDNTDAQIGNGFEIAAYKNGYDIGDNLPAGTIITIVFPPNAGDPADTYIATFTVSYSPIFTLTWTGYATKNGLPCDRNGNVSKNPNKTGRGAGSANVPGGPGGSNFGIGGGDSCLSTTTVTWGDQTYYEEHYTSCH